MILSFGDLNNRENEVLTMIKKEFPRYCGHMFEVLILELFIKRQIPCDLSLSKIGRWWHKDKEIDIVGLNEQNNEILFIECKWSDLRLKEAESVLRELMGKSGFVDWIFEALHRFFLPGIKNANTNVITKIINITKKDCFIAVCVAEYTILLNSFTFSSGYWDRSISACSPSIFCA